MTSANRQPNASPVASGKSLEAPVETERGGVKGGRAHGEGGEISCGFRRISDQNTSAQRPSTGCDDRSCGVLMTTANVTGAEVRRKWPGRSTTPDGPPVQLDVPPPGSRLYVSAEALVRQVTAEVGCSERRSPWTRHPRSTRPRSGLPLVLFFSGTAVELPMVMPAAGREVAGFAERDADVAHAGADKRRRADSNWPGGCRVPAASGKALSGQPACPNGSRTVNVRESGCSLGTEARFARRVGSSPAKRPRFSRPRDA